MIKRGPTCLAATVMATLGCFVPITGVTAQWGIGIELQLVGFGGTSVDTSAGYDRETFRPTSAATVGIRADRRMGRLRIGLTVRYGKAGLVLHRKNVFAGEQGDFLLFEVAPEASFRFAAAHTGATAHIYGGPVIDLWALVDADPRVAAGARVGIGGEFPWSGRFMVWVRAGGVLTRSVFVENELPPQFVLRNTRRSEIALGLRYGR